MARGFEYACEIISDKTSESLQKSLAGTIYKEEKWKNGDKKSFLDDLRMPKLQEIFTTVAIVCHCSDRLSVSQNIFAIILL